MLRKDQLLLHFAVVVYIPLLHLHRMHRWLDGYILCFLLLDLRNKDNELMESSTDSSTSVYFVI